MLKAKKLSKFLVELPKKDFSILLPSLYITILILSFVLTALYYVFPILISCSNILGEEFCTPTGVYVSFMASIPGYLIIGILLGEYIQKIPISISFFFVVGVSVLVYFFLGKLIQNVRNGNILKKESSSKLVFSIFIILLVFLLLLLL